jgi:hypothetical protein
MKTIYIRAVSLCLLLVVMFMIVGIAAADDRLTSKLDTSAADFGSQPDNPINPIAMEQKELPIIGLGSIAVQYIVYDIDMQTP